MAVLDEFLVRMAECALNCHVSETAWDSKGNCVVQLMNAALAEEALLQLRGVFPNLWSRRDCDDIPSDVAGIVERFGGFRDGQFVAATAAMDGVRAWAWWAPWADDVTVSIRVGLLGEVTDSHLLALKRVLLGKLTGESNAREVLENAH
jgi:hypothetical protein